MKSALYSSLATFIQTHHLEQKKLVIALSGGVDSMALCNGLLQLHRQNRFHLEVAHVDHGWREESALQAKHLQQWVQEQGLTFHLHRLTSQPSSDLENHAREERIAFFSRLVKKEGFAGVLLAHHGDDQAETVLKRVLEGSGIDKMVGLKEKRFLRGTSFFRPLLTTSKKVLVEEAKKFNLPIQVDSTSHDTHFLRNRMRHTLIPTLETQFGKAVTNNLLHLSQMAGEVTSLLDQQIKDSLIETIEGPLGRAVTFEPSTHPLVIRHYLKKFAAHSGQILSQNQLDTIIYTLKKSPDKVVMTHDWVISAFKHCLIFIKKTSYQNPEKMLMLYSEKVSREGQNWKAFFKGVCYVPKSYESVCFLSQLEQGRSIRALLSKHRVPYALRALIPLFALKGKRLFHPVLGLLKQAHSQVKQSQL